MSEKSVRQEIQELDRAVKELEEHAKRDQEIDTGLNTVIATPGEKALYEEVKRLRNDLDSGVGFLTKRIDGAKQEADRGVKVTPSLCESLADAIDVCRVRGNAVTLPIADFFDQFRAIAFAVDNNDTEVLINTINANVSNIRAKLDKLARVCGCKGEDKVFEAKPEFVELIDPDPEGKNIRTTVVCHTCQNEFQPAITSDCSKATGKWFCCDGCYTLYKNRIEVPQPIGKDGNGVDLYASDIVYQRNSKNQPVFGILKSVNDTAYEVSELGDPIGILTYWDKSCTYLERKGEETPVCRGKSCDMWTSDGSGCKGFLGDCPFIGTKGTVDADCEQSQPSPVRDKNGREIKFGCRTKHAFVEYTVDGIRAEQPRVHLKDYAWCWPHQLELIDPEPEAVKPDDILPGSSFVFPCPRDIIRVSLATDVELLWEVTAVYLGGLGEESVVELVPVGQKPNSYGKTLIPAQLLDNAIKTGAAFLYIGPNNPNYRKGEKS
jgi:hypothetical protein